MTRTSRSTTEELVLASGRKVSFAQYGDLEGSPVVFFQGTPSTRINHPPESITKELGARLVIIDRPGFGGSDPAPSRTLLDWADDVAEVLSHLEIQKFRVAGVSGGYSHLITPQSPFNDHEPPVSLVTKLAESGIHRDKGSQVPLFDPRTQSVDLVNLEDEVNVEIDSFNRTVSDHEDALLRVEHGYGKGQKPDDYLAEFQRYVRDNLNKLPALLLVAQRPRELTRRQLKELALILDGAGFSEKTLHVAWRDKINEDIAASIIGFIRKAALGDPLVPYPERADRTLKKLLAKQAWTEPQRKCRHPNR